MRLQKINKQLADSRQDLDDMIRDHSIELQIQGLDDLQNSITEAYEKYVKELNSNLDSIANAVSDATNTVVQSAGSVEQTISALLGTFGVSNLDKDSIRYTRQYGVLPDDTVPADIIQLPNGNVLTPVSGGTVPKTNDEQINKYLQNYMRYSGLTQSFTKDPNYVNRVANMGTYQVGIDHMTYNFTISGVSTREEVMNAIRSEIGTISKDVAAQIGREVGKIGLKGTYLY